MSTRPRYGRRHGSIPRVGSIYARSIAVFSVHLPYVLPFSTKVTSPWGSVRSGDLFVFMVQQGFVVGDTLRTRYSALDGSASVYVRLGETLTLGDTKHVRS